MSKNCHVWTMRNSFKLFLNDNALPLPQLLALAQPVDSIYGHSSLKTFKPIIVCFKTYNVLIKHYTFTLFFSIDLSPIVVPYHVC